MKPRGLSAADAAQRLRAVSTTTERLWDAVMLRVAPRSAAIRVHRRLMERDSDYRENWIGDSGLMRARGYKSASSPTNGTPWLDASNRSADSELLNDLPNLRARSRALERNDALASGVIATRRRQVVGSGLRPQSAAGDQLVNEVMEEVWEERKDSLFPAEGRSSFAAAQRVIYTRLLVDGEVMLVRASTPGDPVWFEIVEADRLATPTDAMPEDSQGRIVDGVEKDRWGRAVAYWVSRDHPGDTLFTKTVGRPPKPMALTKADFVRVPADRCRHLRYRVTRPGQTSGLPLFHSVMQDFHDLDLLTFALLKRTQIAACLSLFVKSDQAMSDLFNVTAEDYGYQLDQQLEPGMIFKLFPGEEVQSVIPGFTVPDVEPVQKGMAKRVGAACEMSPEAVLHDWGGTTYSSARTVQIEDNRSYDTDRAEFAEHLTWIWGEVMRDARMRGDGRLSVVKELDMGKARWVGDARPWVDPQSEAQATEIRLRLGLTTLRDEAARLGEDWEELLEQQAKERELKDSLGLLELDESGEEEQVVNGKGKPTPVEEAA